MTHQEQHLVNLLKQRQAELEIDGAAFALLIGISQPQWSLLCSGKRGLGRHVARQILLRCPELEREIYDALVPRAPDAA